MIIRGAALHKEPLDRSRIGGMRNIAQHRSEMRLPSRRANGSAPPAQHQRVVPAGELDQAGACVGVQRL
ncbi:hypothetical protein, partial [Methylobacterium tardum]|uniref:hypothetical protein n=1 Tax=Methylobacterium tardum TaxID=374432 RepID=UPI001EDE757E